jgi:hypothetical protein
MSKEIYCATVCRAIRVYSRTVCLHEPVRSVLQSVLLVYQGFSCTFVPSVALHVVEFTFLGGFESLPLGRPFGILGSICPSAESPTKSR